MLKLTSAVLALALAGTASAGGWRDLRVDGSSEEAFAQSMTAFKDALSVQREYVFGEALKDIWIQGATAADADQREYTADEYYKLLDGLRYEEVVNYTDPTGDTAKQRHRDARVFKKRNPNVTAAMPVGPSGPDPRWGPEVHPRGRIYLFGPGPDPNNQ